jgi:hypothetical protein
MWIVWLVAMFSTILIAVSVVLLRPDLRAAPLAWRLLGASGIPLVLGGLGFIVRFWKPLPGPYLANAVYPLGPYVNAWAVSFGFMWVAFGLVFTALALRAPRTWLTWGCLAVAWLLAWMPHGIIGIGFALAGSNAPSVRLYRNWASEWPGFVVLCYGALVLLAHFGLSAAGFIGAGWRLWRQHPKADAA